MTSDAVRASHAPNKRAISGLLVIGVVYALFISWLDPALPWPVGFSDAAPWHLVLLNVLPVLIVNALLLVATRRVLLASWLTFVVLSVFYAINALKMRELATPLLPDDFHFLRSLGVNYSFFSNYLAHARLQVFIGAIVLAITLLLSREPVVASLRGARRGAIAVGILVFAVTLLQGRAPWTHIYNAGRLHFEPWAPFDSAIRTGVITNMLLFHWELHGPASQPDLHSAAQLLRQSNKQLRGDARVPVVTPDELPDIVIVQSESLFDPAHLAGMGSTSLPHMEAAGSQGWSGELRVPTFGGGTIRTEFEVLTGMPLSAFPQARYPYLQLTRDEFPGLVRVLGSHGYRTLAIHPNGGAFWNRNHAFRSLGFDRFIDIDGFDPTRKHGWYISDAALVDKLIEELPDDGPPQMIMAISIQNHGPYEPQGATNHAAQIAVPSALDASGREALQTYLALVQETDAQLGRLVEFIQSRERRTVLLFYSDHMPPLNGVFEQLGFRDARAATAQSVPWLMLDNRSRDVHSRQSTSWFLPALLLQQAGVPRGRYFDLLDKLSAETSALVEHLDTSDAVRALAQLQYWDKLDDVLDEIIDVPLHD